jgi:hypothetical protein
MDEWLIEEWANFSTACVNLKPDRFARWKATIFYET